jgi:hypothetical protein
MTGTALHRSPELGNERLLPRGDSKHSLTSLQVKFTTVYEFQDASARGVTWTTWRLFTQPIAGPHINKRRLSRKPQYRFSVEDWQLITACRQCDQAIVWTSFVSMKNRRPYPRRHRPLQFGQNRAGADLILKAGAQPAILPPRPMFVFLQQMDHFASVERPIKSTLKISISKQRTFAATAS